MSADAYPGQRFPAELFYINPGVDAQRGAVERLAPPRCKRVPANTTQPPAGSCTGTIASARGEVEGTLAGIDSEIQGIKTDINGALGRAVTQVEALDQELVALEP